jgi:N-acetylglucosaminyldiphosphoundecaprenol N-acetyl-beta-D-mannosaminyltransferase
MKSAVSLDGLSIRPLNLDELLTDVVRELRKPSGAVYIGFYAALLIQAKRNHQYQAHLRNAHMLYPDGWGATFACRILGGVKTPRLSTTDIWLALVDATTSQDKPIVLVGSKDSSVQAAKEILESRGADVSTTRNGYFASNDERKEVARKLAELPPSLVLVGMGAGVQEDFCELIKSFPRGSNHTYFTVGGLFDHVSEKTRRAPEFLQSIGLEWAWRTAQEPTRLAGRYLTGNSYFLWRVFLNRLGR